MSADSASSTAYLIAGSTVFVSRDRHVGRLVPAHAAELCARFINARPRLAGRLLSALSAGRLRRLGTLVERLTVPGIQLHYALRKRFIEEQTRAALAAGFTQAVVLGAGFDTLALRLCGEFPATRFFEIDHAHTQRLKIAALAGSEDARSRNLFFIPLDLARARLETALLSCAAFRRDAKTLFIAEGVLMYLAPGEVDELFRSVRDSCTSETRFVFTFMEPRRADGRLAFRNASRAVDAWLAWRGEPFCWGASRARLAELLALEGFRPREIADADTLRRRYLDGSALAHLPLAAGECICVADRVRTGSGSDRVQRTRPTGRMTTTAHPVATAPGSDPPR